MGRKWTNVRLVIKNPEKQVPMASSNPLTRQEVLNNYLIDRWDEDNVNPCNTIDVMFGNYYNKIEKTVKSLFNEFEWIRKAAAVYVTDSAYVGQGWVFQRDDDGNPILVDEYTGHERAQGADVVGDIYDDYRIRLSEEFYW